ncbi:hypothetical protein E2C01_087595 [Portunus trituberculatus]|uniref:Uncharacterized protein n=1 Tax=Portunus trituberculatus TaxID=210409 RepID=A0A5B7JDS8_PORTR|nr:hypothetical protein [Portunus trituberculatus]
MIKRMSASITHPARHIERINTWIISTRTSGCFSRIISSLPRQLEAFLRRPGGITRAVAD